MKESLIDILKVKFLISEDAVKNWKFIIFTSLLAVIMITSSHSIDKKVFEIDSLNDEVLELKSEFVDVRSKVQQLKLESNITQKVKDKGLVASVIPPKKIKVTNKKSD
ncbi:FtsL-like putative cell division protein [Abyssalbus ytuae]|uniref:S-adenosyl-methyltransferase n=1 Tax=Abyssalbus ytuae TaxID=2926907 RepID=A0A9E6ZME5_9FLAO|nr:FtsL-like putative cell division protein [Abyssalbus ytuae]UOB18497.1 S-adenosyl-methyltransferase [Abyssalbus ytuae]